MTWSFIFRFSKFKVHNSEDAVFTYLARRNNIHILIIKYLMNKNVFAFQLMNILWKNIHKYEMYMFLNDLGIYIEKSFYQIKYLIVDLTRLRTISQWQSQKTFWHYFYNYVFIAILQDIICHYTSKGSIICYYIYIYNFIDMILS